MSWSIQLLSVYFLTALVSAGPAAAQAATRDAIGDWLQANKAPPTHLTQSADRNPTSDQAEKRTDPRSGDKTYEQAKRLMQAIDAILADAAKQRTASQKLPSKNEFILTPLWTETKEDREQRIQELLDAALGIVTDVPRRRRPKAHRTAAQGNP